MGGDWKSNTARFLKGRVSATGAVGALSVPNIETKGPSDQRDGPYSPRYSAAEKVCLVS